MQAVSFMYVRPPGYNAESAKAAEINDEKNREDVSEGTQRDDSSMYYTLCSMIKLLSVCY